MLAAQVGHVKIVETLLDANADPSITDKVRRVDIGSLYVPYQLYLDRHLHLVGSQQF